jgi:ribosomal protein S27E
MGRASDWLREERRKTLGDWVAFCLGCGHVQRYFEELEAELRARCPACEARIASAFAVACEECEAELRPSEAFGVPIRKSR